MRSFIFVLLLSYPIVHVIDTVGDLSPIIFTGVLVTYLTLPCFVGSIVKNCVVRYEDIVPGYAVMLKESSVGCYFSFIANTEDLFFIFSKVALVFRMFFRSELFLKNS